MIRRVDAGGNTTTVAGLTGMAGFVDGDTVTARFASPFGVDVESGGAVVIGDPNNFAVRRYSP